MLKELIGEGPCLTFLPVRQEEYGNDEDAY
jgi:hypothetical protein